MDAHQLRKLAGREIVDYQFLMSALSNYGHPRDKISSWLESGDLIRVKKGLYVFGQDIALSPFSSEVLANLIYGPSVISLNYALAYYGLIPERVTTITCVTNKRNKEFATPVGEFTYRYLKTEKYVMGNQLIKVSSELSFLMASPLKALCDYIHLIDKHMAFKNLEELEVYLLHDLRLDHTEFGRFYDDDIAGVCSVYHDPRLEKLAEYLINKAI